MQPSFTGLIWIHVFWRKSQNSLKGISNLQKKKKKKADNAACLSLLPPGGSTGVLLTGVYKVRKVTRNRPLQLSER